MTLKIEYLSPGKILKTISFDGTREEAAKAAVDGIGQESAELARILDEAGNLAALIQLPSHA